MLFFLGFGVGGNMPTDGMFFAIWSRFEECSAKKILRF